MKPSGDNQSDVLLVGCSLPHIATSDLDVAIVGQLPPSNLPLCDEFEPGAVKVVGFEASFGRRGLWKQDLENAPGNAHHTLIFAHLDAELDDEPLGIPLASGGKRKNMDLLWCSANVLFGDLTDASRCRVLCHRQTNLARVRRMVPHVRSRSCIPPPGVRAAVATHQGTLSRDRVLIGRADLPAN